MKGNYDKLMTEICARREQEGGQVNEMCFE